MTRPKHSPSSTENVGLSLLNWNLNNMKRCIRAVVRLRFTYSTSSRSLFKRIHFQLDALSQCAFASVGRIIHITVIIIDAKDVKYLVMLLISFLKYIVRRFERDNFGVNIKSNIRSETI